MLCISRRTFLVLFVLGSFAVAPSRAAVVVQPDETRSNDTFIYSGTDPAGPPGSPALQDSNFNSALSGFNTYLGASHDASGYASTGGHAAASLLQFALDSIPFTSANVQSATLRLYLVADPLAVSTNPAPGTPVSLDIRSVSGTWTEGSVTWNSRPTLNAGVVTTSVATGINSFIDFDVTQLVKDWIAETLANNGLVVVESPTGSTAAGAGWFASSAVTDSTHRPQLIVTEVPEPTGLAVLGVSAALALRRRPLFSRYRGRGQR